MLEWVLGHSPQGAASHSQTGKTAEVGIDCGKGTGTSAAGRSIPEYRDCSAYFWCCPLGTRFRAHTVGVPTPRTLWAAESFALREVLAGIA